MTNMQHIHGGKMKNSFSFTLLMMFPVFLALYIILVLLISTVFESDGFIALSLIAIVFMLFVTFICSVVEIAMLITKKDDSYELLRVNMIIKMVHIAGFIMLFILAVLFAITVAGVFLSILIWFVSWIMIILSGIIGCIGIRNLVKQGVISKSEGVEHYICQFIFFVDVINAVALYYKFYKTNKNAENFNSIRAQENE